MANDLIYMRRLLIVFIVGCVTSICLFTWNTPIYANLPKLEQIRVALFMKHARFNTPPSVVTLSGLGGIDVGFNSSSDRQIWLSYASNSSIRVSSQLYSIILLQTSDFAVAKSLHNKVALVGYTSTIRKSVGQANPIYQVIVGHYPTLAEVTSERLQLLNQQQIASVVSLGNTQLAGPLYWRIGSYLSEQEAKNQANILSTAGIYANIVLQENNEFKLTYQLWIGNQTTEVELEKLQQQVSASYQGLTFTRANVDSPYVIVSSDVSLSADGNSAMTHLVLGTKNQKTNFYSKLPGITIKEKSGRSYRGSIEVSSYNGHLAVINVLPLEHYLYAVVGSELSMNFPIEALKAQAVAARTYAIAQGNKYQIAHISDTTLDQAYYGIQREFNAATKAVDETKGEVISYQNRLITPFYSSNAGGRTADPLEVWGNPVPYLRSVPSPDDGAAIGTFVWYNVRLTDGREGFVHSDYLVNTGEFNENGIPYYASNGMRVNVRLAPYVDNVNNPAIYQLNTNDRVLMIGENSESNSYSWQRGPYSETYIIERLATLGIYLKSPIESLEVSKRGISGRVMEMKVNGQFINTPYPDAFRTLWGGLPSTRFDIKELKAYNKQSDEQVYVLSANSKQPQMMKTSQLSVLQGKRIIFYADYVQRNSASSTVSEDQKQFVFQGNGNGHGLGMSQWGAKGFAELGYDYKAILKSYYFDIDIVRND